MAACGLVMGCRIPTAVEETFAKRWSFKLKQNGLEHFMDKILKGRPAKRRCSKVRCYRNVGTAFTKKTIGIICMNGVHGIYFSSLTTCNMAALSKLPCPEK